MLAAALAMCPNSSNLSAIVSLNLFVKEFWPMKTISQGNSPQAAATAQKIERKLEELNNKLQNAVVAQVAEDFMDTTTNLKQLEKAARAPPGETQW